MAIQSTGRGHNKHLIKITLGYEQGTRKRLYHTETFKGSKKEARLREAELKIQHRDKKLMRSSGMSFHACFEQYCDEARSRLSLTTFYNYQSLMKCYLLPCIGDKKLKDLIKDDFQKIIDSMKARSLSPHTIRTVNRVARAVITWAMNKKLLSEDILKGVALPKVPKSQPEFLSYEEMQDFIDIAPDYWYGNAFKFQFVTGERNQELMAHMWEDINFETATIRIRGARLSFERVLLVGAERLCFSV